VSCRGGRPGKTSKVIDVFSFTSLKLSVRVDHVDVRRSAGKSRLRTVVIGSVTWEIVWLQRRAGPRADVESIIAGVTGESVIVEGVIGDVRRVVVQTDVVIIVETDILGRIVQTNVVIIVQTDVVIIVETSVIVGETSVIVVQTSVIVVQTHIIVEAHTRIVV
jgi:hypothetical protein